MCRKHTQEHSQRIDGCVCNGGCIVAGSGVTEGKCRRVGSTAGYQTHKCEIVDIAEETAYNTYKQNGNKGNDETIAYPAQTALTDNGIDKTRHQHRFQHKPGRR